MEAWSRFATQRALTWVASRRSTPDVTRRRTLILPGP
jgi:hypothetical protein